MKAFTFLGTGVLHPSNYTFENKKSGKTQFFAEAIVKFFNPDSLYIFATDSAAKKPVSEENTESRLSYIQNLLKDKTKVIHVSIKEGRDEKELWDIFSSVVDNINDNDTVLFDITHGFRSLPFLTFLALAYVSNVKSDVTIEKVIYGAYEAVERKNLDKPVFDLTPFVSLLNWMNAVNVFQNYGDAREIAKLGIPNNIENKLTKISAALLTNRVFEAQEEINRFVKMDMNRPESLQRQPYQFRVLAEKLKYSYEEMGVKDPHNYQDKSLIAQYKQIEWYMKNQHYLQAITLMREWIVSWECRRLKKLNWLDFDIRQCAEDKLNERRKGKSNDCRLWRKCGDLRNDLAHCGMREDPSKSNKAIENTKGLFEDFKKFVKDEGFA